MSGLTRCGRRAECLKGTFGRIVSRHHGSAAILDMERQQADLVFSWLVEAVKP